MSDVIIKWCKRCRKQFKPNKRGAPKKFCCDNCRKAWWNEHVEPRNVCIDCGTLLGQRSQRNKSFRCNSCAQRHRWANRWR